MHANLLLWNVRIQLYRVKKKPSEEGHLSYICLRATRAIQISFYERALLVRVVIMLIEMLIPSSPVRSLPRFVQRKRGQARLWSQNAQLRRLAVEIRRAWPRGR